MHKHYQFLTGRKFRIKDRVFEITRIWFRAGAMSKIEVNGKWEYSADEMMEKEFEWVF